MADFFGQLIYSIVILEGPKDNSCHNSANHIIKDGSKAMFDLSVKKASWPKFGDIENPKKREQNEKCLGLDPRKDKGPRHKHSDDFVHHNPLGVMDASAVVECTLR